VGGGYLTWKAFLRLSASLASSSSPFESASSALFNHSSCIHTDRLIVLYRRAMAVNFHRLESEGAPPDFLPSGLGLASLSGLRLCSATYFRPHRIAFQPTVLPTLGISSWPRSFLSRRFEISVLFAQQDPRRGVINNLKFQFIKFSIFN
jgi:hypothetical protein